MKRLLCVLLGGHVYRWLDSRHQHHCRRCGRNRFQ